MGGEVCEICEKFQSMVASTSTAAKRLRSLVPLLAAPAALLLNPGRADAILTYNIFEDGGNVVVQTSGSLVLPSPTINFASCGNSLAVAMGRFVPTLR